MVFTMCTEVLTQPHLRRSGLRDGGSRFACPPSHSCATTFLLLLLLPRLPSSVPSPLLVAPGHPGSGLRRMLLLPHRRKDPKASFTRADARLTDILPKEAEDVFWGQTLGCVSRILTSGSPFPRPGEEEIGEIRSLNRLLLLSVAPVVSDSLQP